MSFESRRAVPQPDPPSEKKKEDTGVDAWIALTGSLDERTKETRIYKNIESEAEETDDYDAAVVKLRQFLAKRRDAVESVSIGLVEGREISREGAMEMLREIRLVTSMPDRFLGNGATSDVFTLRKSATSLEEMACAKVVSNFAKYHETLATNADGRRLLSGKTMHEEMEVLASLRDFEVGGVRSPKPLFSFRDRNSGLEGYVMEHLNAVNFRRVLDEQTTEGEKDALPKNFDVDAYFAKLRAYATALHERGIVHNDLFLRNMMVDRETGLPYVIDFGKAIQEGELDKTKMESIAEKAGKDMASIATAEKEVREWLAKKA